MTKVPVKDIFKKSVPECPGNVRRAIATRLVRIKYLQAMLCHNAASAGTASYG